MTASADLVERASACAARADEWASAKDAAAAAKTSFQDAELSLVMGAIASDDPEIKALGKAVLELREKIAQSIEEPNTGRRALAAAVKVADASFVETAAAGSDVKSSYAALIAAKAELAEKSAEIRELAKIERDQLKALHAQFKGLF
jgi:hypothetical protein